MLKDVCENHTFSTQIMRDFQRNNGKSFFCEICTQLNLHVIDHEHLNRRGERVLRAGFGDK